MSGVLAEPLLGALALLGGIALVLNVLVWPLLLLRTGGVATGLMLAVGHAVTMFVVLDGPPAANRRVLAIYGVFSWALLLLMLAICFVIMRRDQRL